MTKFRLLAGKHVEGGRTYVVGDIILSDSDLLKFNQPGAVKFELVGDRRSYEQQREEAEARIPSKAPGGQVSMGKQDTSQAPKVSADRLSQEQRSTPKGESAPGRAEAPGEPEFVPNPFTKDTHDVEGEAEGDESHKSRTGRATEGEALHKSSEAPLPKSSTERPALGAGSPPANVQKAAEQGKAGQNRGKPGDESRRGR